MRNPNEVKPISDLTADTAAVLGKITQDREALVIAQNNEAKAVPQDVASGAQIHESLAMLKLLALGQQDI